MKFGPVWDLVFGIEVEAAASVLGTVECDGSIGMPLPTCGGSTPTLEKGWLAAACFDRTGDLGLDPGALPSPSRTRVSMVRSRLALSPFKIAEFRFSSAKPMSLKIASFVSIFSPPPPTLVPKILDCLFIRIGGDGG